MCKKPKKNAEARKIIVMGKSLAKNSIYNIIYKGFTAFFPLITTTYISRTLLAEGVGKVNYASTIVSYIAVIAALGLPQYGIKIIARNFSVKDKSKAFSELFFINLCSSIVCVIAYYSLINFWGYFSEKRFLLNVMGIQLILNVFNIDWFYQGIEEYKYIATRSIIIKILSFIAMLIFVQNTSDYVKYGFILCMATAGNYILNVWNLRNKVKLTLKNVDLKQHLKPVFVLLASTLATEIYTMLDTLMIEHFHGDAYVGYYSNSVKIVRLVHTLAIALVAPFYPRISLYLKEKKSEDVNQLLMLGLRIILVVSIPCVIGIEFLADSIVPVLFGESFMEATTTLEILSPLIIIFSIAYFLGHLILMATNNESKILIATVFGAIVNFCINMFLIPVYKHNGAAIASVIAELLITIILISYSHKFFRIVLKKSYVFSMLISSVLMGAVVYVSRIISIGVILGLFMSLVSGFLSYLVFLFLLKNDIILLFVNKLLNRSEIKNE